jgi:hypothetical protein
MGIANITNNLLTDSGTNLSSLATQTYVTTAISDLVASAPSTLNTLNELAIALGNDANFATTVATSIGTKVPNTRTITINGTAYDLSADRSWTINSMVYPGAGIAISTGSAWGTSITNNSTNWNTAYGWGNHASAGYLTGITSSQVTTALGFTPYNSSNPSGYISSYTETDTLASVTGRGASTSTNTQFNGKLGASDNNGLFLRGHSDATHKLYYSSTRPGISLEINNTFNIDFYNNGSPTTPYTFTTNGIFTTAATINAGDSVTLQGELYLGGVTSNRYFRLVKSGTAESAGILNYQFYTGAGWFTRSTLNSSGNVTYTGTLETGGNVGIRIAPSTAGDTYLKTGDAGIAYQNTYFGTGQVRIGGGSDHTTNVVLSVAPGVVNFDRPGIGGGALKLDSNGYGIFGQRLGIRVTPDQPLTVNQATAASFNQGIPASSGTTQNGILRLTPSYGNFGETLDFGMNVGPTYAWIQATNYSGLNTNYTLALNPNGGQVFIGTTSALQGSEKLAVTSSTNAAILAKFTGGGNQGWGAKIWNDGTTNDNLILEFLTESSITARGSIRYDRSGNRLNIVGEGNGILFTGVGSFTGSTGSVDSIRLYNTDGNYSYIRTTPASNTNNTWFDTPLGATLWLGWDNPGGARTASTYSQVYVGTGRGTTNESIRLHRGDIEGRDGSNNINYRILATGALGSYTYFNYGNVGIGTVSPTLGKLQITGDNNQLAVHTTGTYSSIYFYNGSNDRAAFYCSNTETHIEGRGSSGLFFGGAVSQNHMAINSSGNIGMGTINPLSVVNNAGLQIARGGHTMLILGTGNTHGGVLQASDDNLRMFMGANFYDDVSNSWSQFIDDRGYAAFDVVAEPTGGLARILVGKPNQSGYSGANIFLEAWNSNSTSYLKLRTATDNALYIANSGKIAIGGDNPSLRLSVLETGTVISGGTVTFASQAQGLEIYNNTSGTTDNLVGCWFSTGPHKTGIASGRTNAASNWAVDLRFFVHGPEIANLDQCSEKMRLGGDGTLTVTGDVVAYGSPSDIRLKTIKEKVPNALNSILKLSGYRFDWNETNHLKTTKEDIGVIAQEVADVLPELAKTNEDGFMSVRYQGLTAVLIEAMKEQQNQIEELKVQNDALKEILKRNNII